MVEFDCEICWQRFTSNSDERKPLLLQCGHTFCSSCLQSLLDGGRIQCPKDQKSTPIPEGERDKCALGLNLNYFVTQMMASQKDELVGCEGTGECKSSSTLRCTECDKSLCSSCSEIIHQSSEADLKLHRVIQLNQKSTSLQPCQEHYEYLTLYCEQHKSPMCRRCQQMLCHKGHNIRLLSDIAAESRHSLRCRIDVILELRSRFPKSPPKASERVLTIQQNNEKSKTEINAKFDDLQQMLETRRRELLHVVDEEATSKTSTISQQKETCTKTMAEIESQIKEGYTHIDKNDHELTSVKDVLNSLDLTIEDVKRAEKQISTTSNVMSTLDTRALSCAIRSLGVQAKSQHSRSKIETCTILHNGILINLEEFDPSLPHFIELLPNSGLQNIEQEQKCEPTIQDRHHVVRVCTEVEGQKGPWVEEQCIAINVKIMGFTEYKFLNDVYNLVGTKLNRPYYRSRKRVPSAGRDQYKYLVYNDNIGWSITNEDDLWRGTGWVCTRSHVPHPIAMEEGGWTRPGNAELVVGNVSVLPYQSAEVSGLRNVLHAYVNAAFEIEGVKDGRPYYKSRLPTTRAGRLQHNFIFFFDAGTTGWRIAPEEDLFHERGGCWVFNSSQDLHPFSTTTPWKETLNGLFEENRDVTVTRIYD